MIGLENCTESQRRNALHRALQSRTFSRSEQLRSFLQYVCEAHFQGTTDTVTEYLIGVRVLHRPPDYSPAEDSSVRTRAYELRQKLEKMYATELADDPVQIVIPKGSYLPVFVAIPQPGREAVSPPVPLPDLPIAATPARSVGIESKIRFAPLTLAMLLLAAAVFGAWAVYTFGPRPALVPGVSGSATDPVIAEAWAPFAKRDESALLIPATPLYLVLGPESHGAYRSAIYPAPADAYSLFREHRPLAADAKLGMIFTSDALGVGSMNAVILTSNVLRDLGARPEVLPERHAMLSVIHGRDAVFFGAPVDSQAISDILDKTPLTVTYDEGVKEFVVRDRERGEVFYPEKDSQGDFRTVYGLVSVLNTRDSDRGRLGTVVFSGITSVGTHGAAEYFTSARSLRQLRSIFGKEGISGFPVAYQVVVKCRFENMLLVAGEYQTHRVLTRE